MRRVHYIVASSLDGFIAGPDGEIDWITRDPEMDFGELMARFDAFLMGRHTYELFRAGPAVSTGEVLVFSTTLDPAEHPGARIVSGDATGVLSELKAKPGKDIWLFGGASLFGSLLSEDLVDAVEVSVMPVILGSGLPLSSVLPDPRRLRLLSHRVYGSGIVRLCYDVLDRRGSAEAV